MSDANLEFRLRIVCGTPAFGDMPELHLADILRGIANTVQYVGTAINEKPTIRTPICDVNGIRCGAWELGKTDKKPKDAGRPKDVKIGD